MNNSMYLFYSNVIYSNFRGSYCLVFIYTLDPKGNLQT